MSTQLIIFGGGMALGMLYVDFCDKNGAKPFPQLLQLLLIVATLIGIGAFFA